MVLNFLTIPNSHLQIQNPNPIVYAHCTLKGLQTGVLLGSVSGVLFNLYQMYYSKAEKNFDWLRVGKYARNAIIPLALIVNKMCYDRLSSSTPEQNQSRGYRILKNKGQNLVDDLSIVGFIGGAAFGIFQRQKNIGHLLTIASLGALSGLMLDFGIVFGKSITNRH